MAGNRKLGRPTDHRNAMLRNLVTNLLNAGKITTTISRAKETRSIAEKMITLAKKGDLHSKRQVMTFINDETVVKDLFDDIAPRYENRQGGYTRIVRIGPRRGDAAELVILELV